MDKPKIGDKLFLYGQFMQYLDDVDEYEYNAVMGYMTVGGYIMVAIPTDNPDSSVAGYVAEVPINAQFTPATPFDQMELADVTERLALSLPLPTGTRVWMPTTP